MRNQSPLRMLLAVLVCVQTPARSYADTLPWIADSPIGFPDLRFFSIVLIL